MAEVSLVDDLNGSKADGTVSFGLDGKSYEIDLSTKNAEKLRGAWPTASLLLVGQVADGKHRPRSRAVLRGS